MIKREQVSYMINSRQNKRDEVNKSAKRMWSYQYKIVSHTNLVGKTQKETGKLKHTGQSKKWKT